MKTPKYFQIVFISFIFAVCSGSFARATYFEIISSFNAPSGTTPSSIAWDGATLWMTVADSLVKQVIQLNTDGSVIKSFDWPFTTGQGPSGIAIDGDGFLRIAASSERKIYKFSVDGTLQSYFQTPIPGIRGVTWDGNYLWIAGGGWPNDPDNILYMYKMTTEGGIVDSYSLEFQNTLSPRDLVFDGKNFWYLTQIGDKNLFMISPEGGLLASYHLDLDIGIPGTPHGLTWDGEYLWVTCVSPNVIYQLKPVSPYRTANEYVEISNIPDLNNDSASEVGCLLIDAGTGSSKVVIKDGKTKEHIKSIAFFQYSFTPVSMTALPDMNDNGFPEIAVMATNKISKKSYLMVKDSYSKERISYKLFMNNIYVPTGISGENDMNSNGMPEVTVLQINRTTRQPVAVTRDAMTGDLLRKISFPK